MLYMCIIYFKVYFLPIYYCIYLEVILTKKMFSENNKMNSCVWNFFQINNKNKESIIIYPYLPVF